MKDGLVITDKDIKPTTQWHLEEALKDANREPKSREMALTVTKIQEALYWFLARRPRECLHSFQNYNPNFGSRVEIVCTKCGEKR